VCLYGFGLNTFILRANRTRREAVARDAVNYKIIDETEIEHTFPNRSFEVGKRGMLGPKLYINIHGLRPDNHGGSQSNA
jgi:hypothetical protein